MCTWHCTVLYTRLHDRVQLSKMDKYDWLPKSHSLHLWWTLHIESTLQGMDSTYRILPLRAYVCCIKFIIISFHCTYTCYTSFAFYYLFWWMFIVTDEHELIWNPPGTVFACMCVLEGKRHSMIPWLPDVHVVGRSWHGRLEFNMSDNASRCSSDVRL